MSDLQQALLSLLEDPANDYSEGQHGYSMNLYDDGNRVEYAGFSEPSRKAENLGGVMNRESNAEYRCGVGGVLKKKPSKKLTVKKLAEAMKLLSDKKGGVITVDDVFMGLNKNKKPKGRFRLMGSRKIPKSKIHKPFDMVSDGAVVTDKVLTKEQLEDMNRVAGSGLFGSIAGALLGLAGPPGIATSIAAPVAGMFLEKLGSKVVNKVRGKGKKKNKKDKILLDYIRQVGGNGREREPMINGNYSGSGSGGTLLPQQHYIEDAVEAPHAWGYTTRSTLRRLLRDPNLPNLLRSLKNK